MSEMARIELLPLGKTITVEKGTPLQDVLFAQGVEFPCGGRGRCRGCKIKILAGDLPVTDEDRRVLTEAELASGWRLACRATAHEDLRIELAQWEAAILADHQSVFDFVPQDGLGVAVDLGTTTVVAQLADLRTGRVLAVRMGLNCQAKHGADVMSRVEFAVAGGGLGTLRDLVRGQIGGLIVELLEVSDGRAGELKHIVIVGNTVMHHLFCGFDVAPLAHTPFEPEHDGLHVFKARELGWNLPGEPSVRFLPCLGGFVGSDILAGILATKLHETETLSALIDLGTNGEIVVGNRDRLVCASTAAGPAFEGARISMGMRAATGAISEVRVSDGQLRCHVLGHTAPRGLCGSGLVDAVAAGLDLGWIRPNGRLANGDSLLLTDPVRLTQTDVRELQLAKGAIAAGVRVLVRTWGAQLEDIQRVSLAGAFGNYINRQSARRIGLIGFPLERVEPAGNTALLGAKLALFCLHESDGSYVEVLAKTRHITLHEDPEFQDTYVEEMLFPATNGA
ncbi:MAG: DUF4445 domain-containing protein [Verrucomicrobia bacterium]|nr:DUF4445 domain-containing protein [Verrucomicrobiota bacterium]